MNEEEGMATAPEFNPFEIGTFMGVVATIVGIVIGAGGYAIIDSGNEPDGATGKQATEVCGKGNVMRVSEDIDSFSCWDSDRRVLQP